MSLTAADVIRLLELSPHPEGGHYRETFRDARTIDGGRAVSTAIYFLLGARRAFALAQGRCGGNLALACRRAAYARNRAGRTALADNARGRSRRPASGRRRSFRQAPGRAAQSLGDWTLVGCTVAPGFEFAGFELAPKGWSPQDMT